LRLAKTYPAERMEAAARRCLRARAYNCQRMDSILKNQLDRLPLLGDPPGSIVRLRLRARDIALAVGEPGRLSIRNLLAATVVEIVEAAPPFVEVRLDIAGDPLIASITHDAARALGLRPGLPVTALIKSSALDRFSFGHGSVTGNQ